MFSICWPLSLGLAPRFLFVSNKLESIFVYSRILIYNYILNIYSFDIHICFVFLIVFHTDSRDINIFQLNSPILFSSESNKSLNIIVGITITTITSNDKLYNEVLKGINCTSPFKVNISYILREQ